MATFSSRVSSASEFHTPSPFQPIEEEPSSPFVGASRQNSPSCFEEPCPLCREEMEKTASHVLTACSHVFHMDCFQGVLQQHSDFMSPCPMCREPIRSYSKLDGPRLQERQSLQRWSLRLKRAGSQSGVMNPRELSLRARRAGAEQGMVPDFPTQFPELLKQGDSPTRGLAINYYMSVRTQVPEEDRTLLDTIFRGHVASLQGEKDSNGYADLSDPEIVTLYRKAFDVSLHRRSQSAPPAPTTSRGWSILSALRSAFSRRGDES